MVSPAPGFWMTEKALPVILERVIVTFVPMEREPQLNVLASTVAPAGMEQPEYGVRVVPAGTPVLVASGWMLGRTVVVVVDGGTELVELVEVLFGTVEEVVDIWVVVVLGCDDVGEMLEVVAGTVDVVVDELVLVLVDVGTSVVVVDVDVAAA